MATLKLNNVEICRCVGGGAGLIVYKNNSRKVFASTVLDEAKDGVTDDRVVFQACLGWAELS